MGYSSWGSQNVEHNCLTNTFHLHTSKEWPTSWLDGLSCFCLLGSWSLLCEVPLGRLAEPRAAQGLAGSAEGVYPPRGKALGGPDSLFPSSFEPRSSGWGLQRGL